MIRHLKQLFPEKTQSASEEQARAFIRHAASRAKEYGIVKERDVARYVVLSTLFGARFDSEKRYQWARQILSRIDLDAEARLHALFEAALRAQAQPVHEGEEGHEWLQGRLGFRRLVVRGQPGGEATIPSPLARKGALASGGSAVDEKILAELGPPATEGGGAHSRSGLRGGFLRRQL